MIQAIEAYERNLKSMESDEKVDSPSPLGTIHGVVTGARPPSLNTIHDIITYKGKKVTGDPIMNAKVNAKCEGVGKKNTKTDASGYYELIDLEDGEWKLNVKTKGYEEMNATVKISGSGVYEQNFE